MDCIFCKINNGEIPSYTVYEDKIVKVIMDACPVSNGHMLIIPKSHYSNIDDISSDVLYHTMDISREMHKLLKEKLNIDGLTLCQNNDYGQEVKHYHMHLIPRYNADNIKMTSVLNKDNIEDIFNKITK